MKSTRIVIVGGGISGLAAAYFLEMEFRQRSLPVEIHLLESTPRVGGKIQTRYRDGCLVEEGPDTLLRFKREGLELIEKLGLMDEVHAPEQSGFSILWKENLHRVPEKLMQARPSALRELWKSNLISLPGKIECLVRHGLTLQARPGEHSVASFTRRRWGREVAEKIVDPLLAGVHAGRADQLSMQALYPSMLSMKRYRPSGKADRSPFITLKRGLGSFPQKLAESLQTTRLQTDCEVHDINMLEGGLLEVFPARGASIVADTVFLSCPAPATADLLDSLLPRVSQELREIRYASTGVLTMAYRRNEIGCSLGGTGFLIPEREQRTMTGCTWSSEKWSGRAPADQLLVRVFLKNAESGNFPFDRETDVISESVHEELSRIMNISGKPLWSDLSGWRDGIPQYEIGHLERVQRIKKLLKQTPRLRVFGAGIGGMGIPDCIRQAKEEVAELFSSSLIQKIENPTESVSGEKEKILVSPVRSVA